MDALVPYSIPILGLKVGVHQYKYQLDAAFFNLFEESPVQEGTIEVHLDLDKRFDMLALEFHLKGWVSAECDRCTADIRLPIEREERLFVKYGEQEDEADDEVIFISRDQSSLNVAQYLYEFTVLALPIVNTYDCQNDAEPPCNFEVLRLLEQKNENEGSDSIWDALKTQFKQN